MSDTQLVVKKRLFLSDDDTVHEIKKHLTSQQLLDVYNALEFVKSQTTHGYIKIEIVKGRARRVGYYVSKEFEE